jgi:hypothetical protein
MYSSFFRIGPKGSTWKNFFMTLNACGSRSNLNLNPVTDLGPIFVQRAIQHTGLFIDFKNIGTSKLTML